MLKVEQLVASPQSAPARTAPDAAARDEAMLERAKEFEAVFVAQMLKHSGFEKALSADSGFGGENYASLLLSQYATRIVDSGGFGLAEKIYEQLKAKEAGDAPERTV